MLKIVKVNNKEQVEKWFHQLDVVHESWVIPNLKTKNDLQKNIINQRGFYLGTSIIRIRDLWTQLFEANFPEYQIISNETYLILVKNILEKYKEQIQLNVIDPERQCKELNYFVGLLTDESFDLESERFRDWLGAEDRRQYKLKSTLLVNKLILNILLYYKSIPYEWVTSFLQPTKVNFSNLKAHKYYFDLASEVSMKEAELVYELSKIKEVILFESYFSAQERYQFLLKPYEWLNAKIEKANKIESYGVPLSPKIILRKFSNTMAECRDVVAQVGVWLKTGVEAEKIQVLAPQIETYWPMLEPLFKIEGVPFQKARVSKVSTLPQIEILIAKIRFYQKVASLYDLEKIIFLSTSKAHYSYQDIKKNFSSPFYSFEELLKEIGTKLPYFLEEHFRIHLESIVLEEECEFEVFLTRFSQFFEWQLDKELFEMVMTELISGVSPNLSLSVKDWFEWVILSVQKIEIKIEDHEEGIRVDSLMSSQTFNAEYVYVLGAEDTYFSITHDHNMDPKDILSLSADLGYHLDHPEYNFRSYELESLKERTQNELIISYAIKDISGEMNNPCFLWQKLAFENKITEKEMDQPQPTKWEEWQHADLKTYFHSQNNNFDFALYEKDTDLSKYQPLATDNKINLSPSAIKNFSECSFKFYFEKELKLNEIDIEEVDIANKDKGSWYHLIFQKIIEEGEGFFANWKNLKNETDKIQYLKQKFSDQVPNNISSLFWQRLQQRYFASIIRFVEHEINLKQIFPGLRTLACEARWEVYFDLEKNIWNLEPPNKGYLFRGTIDRILENPETKKLWVVDYKLGSSQAKIYKNWEKENQWQLQFYTLAVEQGWVKMDLLKGPDQREVELAQFWVVNKWMQKKGYFMDLPRVEILGSSQNRITPEGKTQLNESFNKFLTATIKGMVERNYKPEPKNEKICDKCNWSLMCRAPHLN